MNRLRPVVPLLVLALALVACNREETVLSTTSSVVAGGTTIATPSTMAGTTIPEGSTTLAGEAVSDYEVVARLSTANGEVLHIVIPAGGYTDVDLENFVGDLKENDPELWGVEVFDDPTAPEAFGVDEATRTPEQQQLLDRHHLVSLVNGDVLRFQGPFSELGEHVIGS
jgi:hypothetical protein